VQRGLIANARRADRVSRLGETRDVRTESTAPIARNSDQWVGGAHQWTRIDAGDAYGGVFLVERDCCAGRNRVSSG
jgi:hypothetical protein